MGGNNRQQKKISSTFSFFNMFKAKRYSNKVVEDNSWDDSMKNYKVWPSDQDTGRYVADPSIDRKASAYIDKIRTQCVVEDRGQYVTDPGIDRKASAFIDKIRTQCVADHVFQASN